jgi:hypothetical protein
MQNYIKTAYFLVIKKSTTIDPLFDIADIRPHLYETTQFLDVLKVSNSDKHNILIKKY